ncbi:MAG: D-aminoacylase, partial [Bacteroidota bacterium]
MRYPYYFLLLLLLLGCTQKQEQYDLLIKNGLVYDGLGNAPLVADVAISGDSIVQIGTALGTAAKTIDAQGMAVAPGFINMLSWANVSMLVDGRSQGDLRQGVTLEVMGEGRSMGPLNAEMKQNMLDGQQDMKFDIPWTTLGEYLTHLETKGVSINVASFVGNGTLRAHVIGYDEREATAAEMEAMKELLATAMQEGAVGVSSALLYSPSMHANTEELIELAKVAAKYDGLYTSHIRNEGDELFESIEEIMTICREAEVRSEIYHLKASGEQNWWKMDSVIRWIDAARAAGMPITADMYPYNASSTGLHVQLPRWSHPIGIDQMLAKVEEKAQRDRALAEFEFRNPPERILLVGFKNAALRKFTGRRLDEVAAELELDPAEAVVQLIREDQSRIQVVYFSMSEENIDKKIQQPWMSFCS